MTAIHCGVKPLHKQTRHIKFDCCEYNITINTNLIKEHFTFFDSFYTF